MDFLQTCSNIYLNERNSNHRKAIARTVYGMYYFNEDYRKGMEEMTPEKIINEIENGTFIQDLIQIWKSKAR